MIATPPEFIDLTPEMQERLDRFAEEHKDDPVGNVGGAVIFEDERVRMWELVLEPGEASDLHRHELDYYLIIFGGRNLQNSLNDLWVLHLPTRVWVPIDKMT